MMDGFKGFVAYHNIGGHQASAKSIQYCLGRFLGGWFRMMGGVCWK
jgi:hypothetical protein